MLKNRFAYKSLMLFLISPIVSLPFILEEIYLRRKGASFCLAMCMGVLTYLLVPDWSLDLARYYQHFDHISELDFREFLEYLSLRSDYIFYFLFFITAKLGLKFQILLFLLSTFNFYVVFYIFDKISISFDNFRRFKYFIFLILSIGLIYYLTATRFTLAISFLLLFLYNYYFADQKRKAYIFFGISIFIHVAIIFYLPFFLIIPRIKNKFLLIVISVTFLMIPILVPISTLINIFVPIF